MKPQPVPARDSKKPHLEALLDISQEISNTLDLKEVLQRICDEAMQLMHAEICSILLLDEETQTLKIMMARGLSPQVVALTEIKVGSDISGWVAKNKTAIFIPDIEKDMRFTRRSNEKYFTKSLISAPLVCKDKLLGVINVNNKRSRKPFMETDLELLKGFASLAAVALHNARLYEDLQKVYIEVVESFTSALWAKDPYTKEHSTHITTLAISIAREIGLWGKDLEMVRQACHLHDIGKIGIRDSVLNKPGKLNAEEWKEMKLHPLIGAKIIRPLTFLNDVTAIVEQEHERWDGRGYPFGLKGEEIHVGARIVALADAYDAMTSTRCYHKGQTHDWAVAELNRCSGTQFDPKIVDAFNRVLEKGISGLNLEDPSGGRGSEPGLKAH